MTRGPTPSRSRRQAFTLLEVLLSLSIAAVLAAAVFHVMFQLASATEAGNRVAEEAQLARTLLDRMAADIRAAGPGGGVFNAGLNGDFESLQLFANVVPRDLDYDAEEWAPPAVGNNDLVEIWYFLEHEDEEDPESPIIGLSRSVRRGLGSLELEEETDAVIELLAEEVAALRFRYALRGEWIAGWRGSRGMGCPQAIEITLVMHRPDWDVEDQETRLEDMVALLEEDEIIETDAANGIYRLVVLVPTAGAPDRSQARGGPGMAGGPEEPEDWGDESDAPLP